MDASAVVVGSGPNGLAAAIRLAAAGIDVTVLERSPTVGGGTHTAELTVPGLLHDTCSAFHPTAVASPYLRSLHLERFGLQWRWPELDLVHPLDDGRAGVLSTDMDRTSSSLGADGRRWRRIFDPLARDIDTLIPELFAPIIHPPRHPRALARFSVNAALPATWAARRWKDDPAAALLTGLAAHKFGRLDLPLSSSVGLLLTAIGHSAGWPVAAGGSASITKAMTAVLRSHGGRIHTDIAITRLEQLPNLIGATPDIVMLDTSPTAALPIVGDRIPQRIARQLRRYRYGPAAFKVDFALDGDVPWTNADARRAGTVHLGGTAAEIARAEAQTARRVMPERPFVLVGQQYLADSSRCSGGFKPLYAYAHVPNSYAGNAAEAVICQIERFAPGFRERIVTTVTRGPDELAEINPNYMGGDIAVGANTTKQLILRPRPALNPYSLGIPGVYLCSSATPPGGGVHGMCGANAAGFALQWMASQSRHRRHQPTCPGT